jgi:hypothetical protein
LSSRGDAGAEATGPITDPTVTNARAMVMRESIRFKALNLDLDDGDLASLLRSLVRRKPYVSHN